MVHISRETPEQTEARLVEVIRRCELEVFDGSFAFSEFPLDRFPDLVDPDALALVRDDDVGSQLAPHDARAGEAFTVFQFHFPPDLDNSGFVGWLATRLKQRFGTGVFVVCGHNHARGGIFDYWGCPTGVADDVLAEVRQLVGVSGS